MWSNGVVDSKTKCSNAAYSKHEERRRMPMEIKSLMIRKAVW